MRRSRASSWRNFDPDVRSTMPLPATRRSLSANAAPVIVIGLDPGSLRTGFGIIECRNGELRHIRHGVIDLRGREFAQRLRNLHEQFSTLLASILPGLGGIEVAVERAFMHRNADSALKLAQARGALLAAIPASYAIFEYAPRAVKQATVGSGAAGKSQVGHMASRLLGQSLRLPADAADALAVAICHANSRRLQGLLDRGAA